MLKDGVIHALFIGYEVKTMNRCTQNTLDERKYYWRNTIFFVFNLILKQ